MTTDSSFHNQPAEPSSADPTFPICPVCGSDQVVKDAWAKWDRDIQDWTLSAAFDQCQCDACGAEINPEWRSEPLSPTERIRRQNDALRAGRLLNGHILITQGIQALGAEAIFACREAIGAFCDFNPDNDPHNEHDFGALDIKGERVFFKIDAYDKSLECGSPDPSDPTVTTRVMTIMIASEY